MIQLIRVSTLSEKDDGLGRSIKSELNDSSITKIRSVRLYRLEGISENQAKVLAEKLLCERINQVYSLNKTLIKGSTRAIEIAYKPGVMNPEVASIIKAAKDMGINLQAADSSWEYYFFGSVPQEKIRADLRRIKCLNETIEYFVNEEPKTLIIKGNVGPTVRIPLSLMTDAELLSLSKDKLFLNLDEMKIIKKYFQKNKRDPTDCELETIAQTWSEHCAHKTFKAKIIVNGKVKQPLIKRLQKEALKHKQNIVSAFVDNSGVMSFYDGMAICGKVETHNSPSAIEPYGGAMTGSGGVFRDVVGTGLGAKTIASTDMFCFANPELSQKKLPSGCLHPEYLLKRVVKGVKDYGNRMGIPTNNGSVHFHDDFRAKPTIIVGAYGILPQKLAKKGSVKVGDVVVVVGGRTGRDGIHGATFSSAEMTDRTNTVNSSAVQIGNAIEEKRMFDALIEARDAGLIRAIQDCGAGGFSSAIGEMGEKTGVHVDLANAPLKYQGLSPWEIWVSESQERMVIAVPKNKVKKFLIICKKYNVEAAILGKFDGTKKLNVYFEKQPICILDMKFLHHGLPQRTMKAKKQITVSKKEKPFVYLKTQKNWMSALSKVVSHGNVCSKEPIVRLYDHTVQGTSVLQPFVGEKLDGPSDAVVVRPILDKSYGMVIAHGINPVLNTLDPYWGSMWSAVEAMTNYVAVGGNYKEASLINNYIWPFPDEESLWSLEKSVDAVVDIMRAFKIPVISGKDSLSSTYRGSDGKTIKIPPVLCMSIFGRIPDITKTVTSDFKKDESFVYLVGKLDTDAMGGSVFYDIQSLLGNIVPKVNISLLPKIFSSLHKGIQKGGILSCHDISEGGLITALFEMCVGGNVGATIEIPKSEQAEHFLFNETAGCFIVEIESEKKANSLLKNIPTIMLGKTQKKKSLVAKKNNIILFEADIESLKESWQRPMKRLFV